MSLELFRERLSEARKEKGFTQAELARRLGVTAQAVSKWERGNAYPDIELLDEMMDEKPMVAEAAERVAEVLCQ